MDYDLVNVRDNVTVRFKKLKEDAIVPTRGTQFAAGYDVYAAGEDGLLDAGETMVVPLGFAVALPAGYGMLILPRSGLALKCSITVANSPGLIDEDYRGEVCVILRNEGLRPFRVTQGMKIAQLVLVKIPEVNFELVDSLDETQRGSGGFGHTGV